MDDGASELQSTNSLLRRIREGDAAASDRLLRRYLPRLQRWARGRLPARARGLTDTDDLVQVTLVRALSRVKEFEPERKGSFLAYVRRILQNQILDALRRSAREPGMQSLPEQMKHDLPSPLERAIGREKLEAYEKALAKLTPEQQEAVILRFELDFTHAEVAEAIGSPSPNAARMTISRALVRLAEVMDAD